MKRDLEKGRKIAVSILLAIVVICITLIVAIILSEDTGNANNVVPTTEQQ